MCKKPLGAAGDGLSGVGLSRIDRSWVSVLLSSKRAADPILGGQGGCSHALDLFPFTVMVGKQLITTPVSPLVRSSYVVQPCRI